MASNNTIFPAGDDFLSGDGTTLNKLLENPNQYTGSKAGLEAKAVEGGMYVRIDMPGVEKDDVEVWMEDKTVFFIGEAKKQWEHEPSGRIYGGNIDLSSDSGEVTEVKTDVQNGVLRMILVGCRIKPDLSAITKPSSSTKKSDKVEYEFMIVGNHMLKNRLFNLFTPPEKCQGYYPFQVGGPGGAYEAKIIDQEHMYLRMDMPDVSKEDTVVQFRDNLVLYGGTGVNGSVHDGEKRKYFGKFELKCGCCTYVNVKSEMKAGVLRMLISKRKI